MAAPDEAAPGPDGAALVAPDDVVSPAVTESTS
jgi:hypothetical protein